MQGRWWRRRHGHRQAERKAFKRAYEELCGIDLGDDADVIDVQATAKVSVVKEYASTDEMLSEFRAELAAADKPSETRVIKEKWEQIAADETWTDAQKETMIAECRARYAELSAAKKKERLLPNTLAWPCTCCPDQQRVIRPYKPGLDRQPWDF